MTLVRLSCFRIRSTTGRRLLMLGLTALVSCFMLVGTSEAVAKATVTTSSTRAQKLSKALKACKKQPKKKRAACVKRAKKKYGVHHAVTQPPATTPTGPAPTPTAPVTPPTGPVTPPAGPVTPVATSGAPSEPTQAWLQQEVERFEAGNVHHGKHVSYVTILARGTPHLGSGIAKESGGDGVPSTEWVYPLEYSYQVTYEVATVFNSETSEWEYYLETEEWRQEAIAILSPVGQFALRTEHSFCTSRPEAGACKNS